MTMAIIGFGADAHGQNATKAAGKWAQQEWAATHHKQEEVISRRMILGCVYAVVRQHEASDYYY